MPSVHWTKPGLSLKPFPHIGLSSRPVSFLRHILVTHRSMLMNLATFPSLHFGPVWLFGQWRYAEVRFAGGKCREYDVMSGCSVTM